MQIDNKDLLTLVKSFARANPLPLDKDEIKGSIAEAEAYLKSPIAYPGQTIKVLGEDGKYQMFIVQKDKSTEDLHLAQLESSITVEEIENAIGNSFLKEEYEISNVPEGTFVDYRDKEIRVMCPENTEWVEQSVGPTGNPNMYYMAFKAYAPEGAVSFKEGDRGVVIDKMYTFDDDFAGIDKYGRKYSICWLALASKDAQENWTYFGKNSSVKKYIGWDYIVEWYNEKGAIINSDNVRINLSNESCHFQIEPSYLFKAKEEAIEAANAYTNAALTWGSF